MRDNHGTVELAGQNIDRDLPFQRTDISTIVSKLVTECSCTYCVVRSLC